MASTWVSAASIWAVMVNQAITPLLLCVVTNKFGTLSLKVLAISNSIYFYPPIRPSESNMFARFICPETASCMSLYDESGENGTNILLMYYSHQDDCWGRKQLWVPELVQSMKATQSSLQVNKPCNVST